jgi:PatG Domain
MNQTDALEQSANQPVEINAEPISPPFPESRTGTIVIPQSGNGDCGCGGSPASATPPAYIYAIGKVGWRFPKQAVEKEFAQATGRAATMGLTDQQAFYEVLCQRQNRYLVRQLCWVLTIEGLETYLLMPRDPTDLDLLVEAVRPAPSPMDLDIVVGMRGPIAPPEVCNGLMVPIVVFDQLYSFDRNTLMQSIPRPEAIAAEQFTRASEELFDRIMLMADNAGATDEHRALNYCAVRYPAIYAKAAEAYGQNCSMTSVEARPSTLSGTRKIMEVIFAFTNRNTDVTEKYFIRVDVTEEFPFLVTMMSPYYDR